MCNKLASRHVRVGLADPSVVPRCDICENAPGIQLLTLDAFGFCEHINKILMYSIAIDKLDFL